jgi:short-subunit dehydrogenase
LLCALVIMNRNILKTPRARPRLVRKLRAWRDQALQVALTGGGPMRPSPLLQRRARHASSAPLTGRCVLITGASSGIGRALAIKLAEAGVLTVLVARSGERLQALHSEIRSRGGKTRAYAADLSSPADIDSLLQQLQRDGVVVDALVNNAGRSIRRAISEAYARPHDYERTMALNYFGSVRLILGLLPGMRARGRGHVLNVSSAGVQMGSPLFSAYLASKAALDAFTRVAANETHAEGVCFTTVHMPLVRTPMIAPTAAFQTIPALSAEDAADIVIRALLTGERQLGTWLACLTSLGYILAPTLTERALGYAQRASARPAPVLHPVATDAAVQHRGDVLQNWG